MPYILDVPFDANEHDVEMHSPQSSSPANIGIDRLPIPLWQAEDMRNVSGTSDSNDRNEEEDIDRTGLNPVLPRLSVFTPQPLSSRRPLDASGEEPRQSHQQNSVLPFTVFVDLRGTNLGPDEAWPYNIAELARLEIARRQEQQNFPPGMSSGNFNPENEAHVRFDGWIPVSEFVEVGAGSDWLEHVYQLLYDWLIEMRVMCEQGGDFRIPWKAGYWSIAWAGP